MMFNKKEQFIYNSESDVQRISKQVRKQNYKLFMKSKNFSIIKTWKYTTYIPD